MERYKKHMVRYKKICAMAKDRFSQAEIAKELGLTRQRVSQILAKPPVKPKPRNKLYVQMFKEYGKELEGRERTRGLVRLRDKFTCQDCGRKLTPKNAKLQNKRLFDVHHLNGLCGKMSRSYDSIDSVDGMITLCHKCHYNRPEHKVKSKDFRGGFGRKVRLITDKQVLEIKTLRDSGLTFKEIANTYRVNLNTIRYWYSRSTEETLKATEARKNKVL